jgi:hypothetical protein
MTSKFAFALLSILLTGSWSVHAQTSANTDPYLLFAKYVQAVNAGDKAAVRNLISDQVERSSYRGCQPELSNRDCLLSYIVNTVIDKHGSIKETKVFGVDGDTLYGGLELRSDMIRAAGAKRAMGIDKIRFKDNKLMSLAFLPNLNDAQTKKFFDYIRATGTPSSQPYVNRPAGP